MVLAYATVLFYIANEGLSVIENLAEIGVKVPSINLDKLHVISNDDKERVNNVLRTRNRSNLDKLAINTKKVSLKWYEYCVENRINILIYETIRTAATQQEVVVNEPVNENKIITFQDWLTIATNKIRKGLMALW